METEIETAALQELAAGEAPLETPSGGEQGPADPRWWGELNLEPGQAGRWRAGPSTVHVLRTASDWRLWHQQELDAYAPIGQWPRRIAPDELPEGAPLLRLGFSHSPDTIQVSPVLAPRSVVVRPQSPLAVPPGERVTVYVSSPTWMSVSVQGSGGQRHGGKAGRTPLADLPTHRPSDTWFGPSTREGELCYAVRTAAQPVYDDLPLRPHRAVTPLTIQNEADDLLSVQRVRVPLSQLSLYVNAAGRLLTDGVLFRRDAERDFAELRVTELRMDRREGAAPSKAAWAKAAAAKAAGGVIKAAADWTRLAPPRTPLVGNVVMRAFSRFFRGDEG